MLSQDVLTQLNTLTQLGKTREVVSTLLRVMKDHPARNDRPMLADVAYRNDAIELGLTILHPIIREARDGITPASAEAMTTYATLLQRIGAIEEAESLLLKVKDHSPALLRLAFVYFTQWDYRKAIPLLQKYVLQVDGGYEKLVGKINLLAALIAAGQTTAAQRILEELIPELEKSQQYKLLRLNSLELQAQMLILNGDIGRAELVLNKAVEAIPEQSGRYLLYVNKWQAVIKLITAPNSLEAQYELHRIRQTAQQMRQWETTRDCDFHLARLTDNTPLLQRVLLGTPYRAFHERNKNFYGITYPTERRMVFCPGAINIEPQSIALDLEQIALDKFMSATSWTLAQLMVKDLFRPPRIGVIFAALYPGEHFDVFHSPQRVRNCVFRFNYWAQQARLNIGIKIRKGDFVFLGLSGQGIACRTRQHTQKVWQALLSRFRARIAGRSFTSHDLANACGLSQQRANTIIKLAIKSKKVDQIGKGRSARYIFSSHRPGRQKVA